MPLSDHEQRLLEQMERALYQEDPKFASSLRHGRGGRFDRKRVLIGATAVIAGLILVVAGVATSLPIIGVIGFAAMVAGAFLAFTGSRQQAAPNGPVAASGTPGPAQQAPRSQSSFMTKMEDRWRKRREGRQGS